MNRALELLAKFQARFGTSAVVYRAPGRVNLIGEHTDYNDGFVLPAAIGLSCWVAIAPRKDRKLVLVSENFAELIEADLDKLPLRGSDRWADYLLGVALTLEHDVAHLAIDRTNLALICQLSENQFVGARCGIMDQFFSCHGRAGHALILDCRSLDYRVFRLPPNLQLIICNTMVKHELGTSEYNARRAECEEAVRRLTGVLPGIRALRDVTLEQLEEHRHRLTDILYKRCRHVLTENLRVRNAVQAFETGEIGKIGKLMVESHSSLQNDYEVSCRELDIMVEISSRQRGVYGARMTGGGFGGCTINLVDAADAMEFQRRVAAEYESETNRRPDIYICAASQGVEAISTADLPPEANPAEKLEEIHEPSACL